MSKPLTAADIAARRQALATRAALTIKAIAADQEVSIADLDHAVLTYGDQFDDLLAAEKNRLAKRAELADTRIKLEAAKEEYTAACAAGDVAGENLKTAKAALQLAEDAGRLAFLRTNSAERTCNFLLKKVQTLEVESI
jgi:hypothetical protein